MEIYVLGIPDSATEDTIKEFFKRYGKVTSVRIMTRRKTGRRTGCLVEMPNEEEALSIIAELNGKEFQGNTIFLHKSRPTKYPPKTE
jgi:RNA recognition motif-containing protein